MTRTIALFALALCLLLPPSSATAAEPLTLYAKPVPLNPEDPTQRKVGQLDWRGSLEITSPDSRFGGLSGLLLDAEQQGLLAITDTGYWVTAALRHDEAGMLIGLEEAEIGRLRDGDGRVLASKRAGDAEALARLADGSTLVAFEQAHRIWRYPAGPTPLERPAEAFPSPPNLSSFKGNGGLEAVAELPRGRLLGLVEHETEAATLPGFLWHNGKWAEVALTRLGPYRPTGAAALPSGDVLLLERRFSFIGGLGIKIRRLPLATLKPGATLDGEVVAEFHPPLIYDNMEGIAIAPESGGARIYIVADDNFNASQRTVLMSFLLAGD